MKPSLIVIAGFLLAHVAAQGSESDGQSAGHERVTASLRGSRHTTQSWPQVSFRQQEIHLVPAFCKKTVNSLKKHALHKIHTLNHTLVATKQDLTREQKLRTAAEQSLSRERSLRSAAEQNAASLASQLASLKQAYAEAKANAKAEAKTALQQLADELKLADELREKLKLANQEVANEKAKLAIEQRVVKTEKRIQQQIVQQLNQTRHELAEKSEALALINITITNEKKELNTTHAQLSADEAQLRSAENEVTKLSLALQEESALGVKQKTDAKQLEQKDMKQITDLMNHVILLSDKIARLTASNAEANATEVVLQSKLFSERKEIESEKKEVSSVKKQLSTSRDNNKKLTAEVQSLAKSLDTEKKKAAKDDQELATAVGELSKEEKKSKAARTDAMEKAAKLTQVKSDLSIANSKVSKTQRQLKDTFRMLRETEASALNEAQQLKAKSAIEKELREKLHAAEVSIDTKSKMLQATSDDAKKLRVNLYTSEATAKWESSRINATVKVAQEVGAELRHARLLLSAKQEELKAATEETRKLGGSLKSALLNSEALTAKLVKLNVDKRLEDQKLKAASKEASQFEGKLHDAKAKLDSARAEIRTLGSKSNSDSAQLAKLRSSLRGLSEVATRQTQAFRNFEYIDEQLRAELHNVVPETGMLEVKTFKSPSQERVTVSTTAVPKHQSEQQEDVRSSVVTKSPKASFLSSQVDQSAEALFDYLKDEMADGPEAGESNEETPVQGEADLAS